MIIQAIVFTVIFLLLSAFMVAISFHVYRFRYPHDNTGIVFVALAVIFILITIMTFLLFDFSVPQTTGTRSSALNTLL